MTKPQIIQFPDEPLVEVDVNPTIQPEVVVVIKEVQKRERPDELTGTIYRLRTPLAENPLYITIGDITVENGEVQPFEIFINTKNVESHQWVTIFTRLISSIFRRGGDVTFILDELKSVHDPNGGYLSKNGKVPSLVAEIGAIIEKHFYKIGLLKREVDPEKLKYIEEKKKQHDAEYCICPKCNQKSMIVDGGCMTCTNADCLYDKCG